VDGIFQKNYLTNGFVKQLKAFAIMGCAPESLKSAEIDISPIDETAAAVVNISLQQDNHNHVFHLNSSKPITFAILMEQMNKNGYPIKFVKDADFFKVYKQMLNDEKNKKIVSEGMIELLDNDAFAKLIEVKIDNHFTVDYLRKNGFK
jgi:hypothetical protein